MAAGAKPLALILSGDGINCDAETTFALSIAGFGTRKMHTSEFLSNPAYLFDAQLLAIPGGFSFGDEIASGKVLAVKFKHKLRDTLYTYIDRGGLVLGICNGFQVLTQLGLLPLSSAGAPRLVSLERNSGGKFINRWVELEVEPGNPCAFFRGLKRIALPIRHGEGRLALGADDPDTAAEVKRHAALRYAEDVNGSFDRIAALTNSRGNVMGLMPHPEAFIRWTQHPAWPQWKVQQDRSDYRPATEEGDGLIILRNAFEAITQG